MTDILADLERSLETCPYDPQLSYAFSRLYRLRGDCRAARSFVVMAREQIRMGWVPTELTESDLKAYEEALDSCEEAAGEKLTSTDVKETVRSAVADVRTCALVGDHKGVIRLSWHIQPNGSVTNVTFDDPETWASTESGACMVEVVEGLKFPKHAGPAVKVKFPFRLQ